MSGSRKPAKKRSVTVSILRCPSHGFYCVAVGDRRVTPSKCCGSWSQEVRAWTLDALDLLCDVKEGIRGK